MLQAHLYSQDDQDHLEIREVFNVHIQLYEPCTQTFFFPEKKFVLLQLFCKVLAWQSSQFYPILNIWPPLLPNLVFKFSLLFFKILNPNPTSCSDCWSAIWDGTPQTLQAPEGSRNDLFGKKEEKHGRGQGS